MAATWMNHWKRTFWVVWLANLITSVGMMSFLPFFPSYLEELGVEDRGEVAAWTGVIFGAAPFVAALLAPMWGVFGDRFGRKLMIVRALIAITLFVGCMGLVTAPWQLLVLRILQGCFSGFVAPSVTLVSVAVPDSRQGRVAGDLQTSLAAGTFIGPLVGAWIRSEFGVRVVFLGVAAASLFSLLLVVFLIRDRAPLRERAQSSGGKTPSIFATLRRDLSDLRELPNLRWAVIFSFLLYFGIGAGNPQMELLVRDLLPDASLEVVGQRTALLFSCFAAASLFATPLWGRYGDRRGHRSALVGSGLLCSASLFLHAFVPFWGLLSARVLLGGSSAGAGPSAFGVAASETRAETRGGAFGLVFSARALALSTSAMLGGWLSAWIGIRGVFLLGSGLILVVALLGRRQSGPREGGGPLPVVGLDPKPPNR